MRCWECPENNKPEEEERCKYCGYALELWLRKMRRKLEEKIRYL